MLCIILTFSCIISVSAYSFSNNGTATKKATAYRLPSVNSGDVWWVDKNDKLQVFCRDGDYYLVLYPFNNTGKHVLAYVPVSAVNASGVPNASGFYKNEIVRTKANANLYHNPSTDKLIGASGSNQTVRATVSKGQELTVLFEKDGFYCVRTSNDTGFIEKNKICVHSNVSKQKTSSGNVTNINDETYHEITTSYKETCSDCGLVINTNISETQKEKHAFSNNKCSKCGYEIATDEESDICKHESTYTANNSITYGYPDIDVKVKDDEYHIGYYYADEYCLKCRALVNKKVVVEEESLHNYLNGICTSCLHSYFTQKPGAAQLEINKTTFTPGEKIQLNWTHAERTANYDIHIYKEGMASRYRLDSGYTDPAASITINDEGTYKIAIYAVNNQGYTAGNIVTINVKKPATERTAWVYNTEGKNLILRSGTSTKTSIVAKMPEGSTITVTGDATNGFYPVKYGKYNGYASSAYITFTKPSTTTSNLSTNNNYVWPSSGGYHVTVLEYYWGNVSSGSHPTKGNGSIKGAIDIGTAGNALATASGTIVEVQYSSAKTGWGNTVTIRHNDGTYSFYAHLAKINVSKNQKVTAGQSIGVIGATGYSKGVHLHFEIWDSSKNTIYTINAFKDKYKKNLRFDSDIVSGGSNNSTIKQWIKDNYKLSGKIYIAK